MSVVDFDAVIAGGGLSGLSLAAHLAAEGWQDRRVVVVDDPGSASAVGWGFWSARPRPLDAAVSQEFRRVRIHADGAAHVVDLHPYRYRVVRRPDLQRLVDEVLSRCPGFVVRAGRIDGVHDGADSAVTLIDGDSVTSEWAFDSVTMPSRDVAVDARLAFTGWEVRADGPVFDPDVPVLCDFRVARGTGARFVYVLPRDGRHALVELTEFVPRRTAPPARADREVALRQYIEETLGIGDYEITRTESAVLPLRAHPPERRSRHVLAIGAAGGLIKASTGYAYERIQRDSAAISHSLARHGHPFDLPTQRPRFHLLDEVLLEALDEDPGHLERAFGRLFTRNPAHRVLRFLDEDTGLVEEMRIIASLPRAPYVRALARVESRRARPPDVLPAENGL